MRIAMITNTYLPLVGGVSNSVAFFADAIRGKGHRVIVVAPEYEHCPDQEEDVLRVPATEKLTGGQFAVHLPLPSELMKKLERFEPDLIHSHHPFILGDTALRVASSLNVPLVYTYHTQYEHYTHYLPVEDSDRLKTLAVEISTGYCNMTDHVIAPSESIRKLLKSRGVTSDMTVIPTGIDLTRFNSGDGAAFRKDRCILDDTFVIGHVGRLAPEKNCRFLARSAVEFIKTSPNSLFLVIGDGTERQPMMDIFADAGIPHRMLTTGVLKGQPLIDAYHAMDVFLFASLTETQGMVLAEALSTGIPVVALDAPGTREVLQDGVNGRRVDQPTESAMSKGLQWVRDAYHRDEDTFRKQVIDTVTSFSRERSVEQMLDVYAQVVSPKSRPSRPDPGTWRTLMNRVAREWDIWSHRISAIQAALRADDVDLDV